MQATLIYQPEGSDSLSITRTLKVITFFEDHATARQAQTVYDALRNQLGEAFELDQQIWKLSLLANLHLREIAAKEAAEADLIVFAAHGDSVVPDEVKACVELWLGRSGNPTALVAVLDRAAGWEDESDFPLGYLREVARRGCMDFYALDAKSPGLSEDASDHWPMSESSESLRPRWV